jgi:hypothetical protein
MGAESTSALFVLFCLTVTTGLRLLVTESLFITVLDRVIPCERCECGGAEASGRLCGMGGAETSVWQVTGI